MKEKVYTVIDEGRRFIFDIMTKRHGAAVYTAAANLSFTEACNAVNSLENYYAMVCAQNEKGRIKHEMCCYDENDTRTGEEILADEMYADLVRVVANAYVRLYTREEMLLLLNLFNRANVSSFDEATIRVNGDVEMKVSNLVYYWNKTHKDERSIRDNRMLIEEFNEDIPVFE